MADRRPRTVRVGPLPDWMPTERLLGFPHELEAQFARLELTPEHAADVLARLRGLGFGGQPIEVEVRPPLDRKLIRAARTEDARRRRRTTAGFSKKDVRLDDEGRMSLTPESLALDIGKRANVELVVDACCGVGGNAIGFARAGARVIAIDHDAARLEMARHNAAVYEVEGQIEFLHGDANQLLEDLEAPLLFCDPPWGEAWDRTRVTPDELPLVRAMTAHASRFGEIWFKVPPSFDSAGWSVRSIEPYFGEAEGDFRRVKFLLVRV